MPFEELAALHSVADVCLVTSLRDGMNVVSQEFVACQQSKVSKGVLVLSEFAGAAKCVPPPPSFLPSFHPLPTPPHTPVHFFCFSFFSHFIPFPFPLLLLLLSQMS